MTADKRGRATRHAPAFSILSFDLYDFFPSRAFLYHLALLLFG